MVAEADETPTVRGLTLFLMAMATLALELALLEPGRWRWLCLAQTSGLYVTPMLAAAWWLRRRCVPSSVGTRSLNGTATSRRGRVGLRPLATVTLLTLFALPFAVEAARLAWLGSGRMLEVVLLAALRNLGLGVASLAHRRVFAQLTALITLFLALTAASLGDDPAVLVLVGTYAVAGTLWLMVAYWTRLYPSGSGRPGFRFPMSSVAWILVVILALFAAMAVGPTRAATVLLGLMPTSGGTLWSDPDARSGVNDGDNEVGASEHPESVGFTESEVYLETDRPSLYDAFNETYGEPFKPKKVEKMIALGQQDFGEQKERPSENLRAGREFSAVRRKPGAAPRRPDERAAAALVYVKGPTPLHLPLATFSHFDGRVWREEPCCNRDFPAETEPSGAWLRLLLPRPPYLAAAVSHQIKIGSLESSPIPMPAHPVRFRVGSVNRLDFFGWAQFGIIRMTDRTVPAGTVIDSEALTVDPVRLRPRWLPALPGNQDNHHLSFQGSYAIDPSVAALARAWVMGRPEGWCQVESVIAALRAGWTHDRSATAPPDCNDVVAEFLLRGRRGPDYLFASSAAVLLRSLGYPARVVSGLYAAPGRYDPRTGHTPVTGDDVHFWVEVLLPSGRWIAVEPTPGYELMPPAREWAEQIAGALFTAWKWARDHAAGLLAAAALLAVLALRRRDVLDRCATIALGLAPGHDPRRFVMRALKLIELRARWAGQPRPSGLTLARWYFPVADRAASEPRAALEGFVRLADWAAHAPSGPGLPVPATEDDIRQTCRSAIRAWTLSRFRQASPSPRKKVATI